MLHRICGICQIAFRRLFTRSHRDSPREEPRNHISLIAAARLFFTLREGLVDRHHMSLQSAHRGRESGEDEGKAAQKHSPRQPRTLHHCASALQDPTPQVPKALGTPWRENSSQSWRHPCREMSWRANFTGGVYFGALCSLPVMGYSARGEKARKAKTTKNPSKTVNRGINHSSFCIFRNGPKESPSVSILTTDNAP